MLKNNYCWLERLGWPKRPGRLGKHEKLERLKRLNRWSLGDFTKMEGTQMEMFNFLWLIWDHYLPLIASVQLWKFKDLGS